VILELVLGAAAIAAATAVARVVLERRAQREEERLRKVASAAAATDPRRGLRVGDVLLHVGDELWLAGLVELDEEGTRIRLFRVPASPRASWVAQLDDEARELALLSESPDIPDGSVPDRLPLGGRLLSLRKRGRAKARGDGESIPAIGAAARFTILGDAGGRIVIVVDFEGAPRLALVGDRVERALVDVLPGDDVKRAR
jgi:hypothetical protein